MQNSEYLALSIVCQRIYSDVLWHYVVLYNRTVWVWNSSPPPHLWSSLPWLLSHACYDIHMEGSALLFLRLFGLFDPLSACIPAETQSHVQAWTWESGLPRPNPAPWSVDPCARSPAVSVKRTTLPTQCVLSGSLGSQHLLCWAFYKVSICLEDSLSFLVLSFKSFICAP